MKQYENYQNYQDFSPCQGEVALGRGGMNPLMCFIKISFRIENPSVPPKRDISPEGANIYVF
jgi:hypothetical protein